MPTYFVRYRLFGNENRLDVGHYHSYAKLELQAVALGVPKYEYMSATERRLVFMATYLARVKVMRDCGNFVNSDSSTKNRCLPSALVVKHFPGAPGYYQEAGELKFITHDMPLSELLSWQRGFDDNFRSSVPSNCVMMSHTSFPSALKELRENSDEYKIDTSRCWATSKCDCVPCTLSPFIVRGLLRTRFGFRGAVISDWACMGSIHYFTSDSSNFPGDMAGLSPMSRLTICAVEAGLDFCLGYNSKEPLRIPDSVVSEVEDYAKSHTYWYEVLDEQIAHSLQWCKDVAIRLTRWEPPSPQMLSLKEKLTWFFGFQNISPKLSQLNHVHTENYEDVCSRGGILTSLLRYYCVTSTAQGNLIQCEPQMFKTTNDWLQELHKNGEYSQAYCAIDWSTFFDQSLGSVLSSNFFELMIEAVLGLPPAKPATATPNF